METPRHTGWIDREETVVATLDPWPVRALRATLGLEPPDAAPLAEAPALWSWLYFLDTTPRDELGADGHAALAASLPPIGGTRRMFAGGRAQFVQPLRLGEVAERSCRILAVDEKAGASGPLTFVRLGFDIRQEGALCVREERDLVYLPFAAAPPRPAPAAVPAAPWALDLTPDPVLLMRMSALTFNGHRIHYDADYARDVEGYPERVVHGPLTALLLAELARLQGGVRLTSFSFRARTPLFCGRRLHLRGAPDDASADLTAYDDEGRLAMSATCGWS